MDEPRGTTDSGCGASAGRELIVVAKSGTGLRVKGDSVFSSAGKDVSGLSKFLASEGLKLKQLFETDPSQFASNSGATTGMVPHLSVFFGIEAPDERLDDLAEQLRQMDVIEAAYVKPALQPACIELPLPQQEEPPQQTPDFTPRQGYLNPAPEGVDANYAWTRPGGSGARVQIIDLEHAWRFTHEDLLQNQGGLISGTQTSNLDNRNHGTAVLGEFSGDRNNFGVTGISPDANVRALSFEGRNSASVIQQAADNLRPGDILLIEAHRPGPRFNYQDRKDQRGYIAVEWWWDDFAAIRYAINRGIVVVEAAGNGGENLDDSLYDNRPGSFPLNWCNPFRRGNCDSGAIVVGAGAPPPGTHGRDYGPDRSRLEFSNWGEVVDAQGWGREVTSTGYGDLQGGTNEDRWYTDQFAGTSSASPIVVGALACVQGVLGAYGRIRLSPARTRSLLRTTGSPQQDAPDRPRTQRIGNRPNLRQLIAYALVTQTYSGVQFTGTVDANQTKRWFTYNWPAHWHVVWTVVPTSPRPGGPQIEWKVQVERASDAYITYWINITNLTPVAVNIEARFDVLGW